MPVKTKNMPKTYDVLKIDLNRCPPECRLCEEACIKAKGEDAAAPGVSRISTVRVPQLKFNSAITCVQCSQPRCVDICPAGAIGKNTRTGVVTIDEEKCVGCGLCTVACRYGGIYYNPQTHHSFKCDRCNGDPKCVTACKYGVLSYVKNKSVLSYLGEDVMSPGVGACRGCLAEMAMRFTLRVMGPNTILFMSPGCAISFGLGNNTQSHINLANFSCLLDNTASNMTGFYRAYRRMGRDDVNLVAFVGDGATVDIGFQSLSAAAERRERFIYICNDNEGYMNTGIQRSSSTPYGAQTTTTPVGVARRGKRENAKYLPLIMLFNEAAYVATATMAYPEDFAKKLVKAQQIKDGLSYIHVFLPCNTGWGIPEDRALDVARLAVETNYFPLWEAVNGKVRFTHKVAEQKPVREYIRSMNKYAHLTDADIEYVQETVDKRYEQIRYLSAARGVSKKK